MFIHYQFKIIAQFFWSAQQRIVPLRQNIVPSFQSAKLFLQ